MNGKGDDRRPSSVPTSVFEENWKRIFGGSQKIASQPQPQDALEAKLAKEEEKEA